MQAAGTTTIAQKLPHPLRAQAPEEKDTSIYRKVVGAGRIRDPVPFSKGIEVDT